MILMLQATNDQGTLRLLTTHIHFRCGCVWSTKQRITEESRRRRVAAILHFLLHSKEKILIITSSV